MISHGSDGCDKMSGVSSMETSFEQQPVMEVSGLEKKVAEEKYGSWMVFERRKSWGNFSVMVGLPTISLTLGACAFRLQWRRLKGN